MLLEFLLLENEEKREDPSMLPDREARRRADVEQESRAPGEGMAVVKELTRSRLSSARTDTEDRRRLPSLGSFCRSEVRGEGWCTE